MQWDLIVGTQLIVHACCGESERSKLQLWSKIYSTLKMSCISEMRNLCLYWVTGQHNSEALFLESFPQHVRICSSQSRTEILAVEGFQNTKYWLMTPPPIPMNLTMPIEIQPFSIHLYSTTCMEPEHRSTRRQLRTSSWSSAPQEAVADPGVVRLVRSNPPPPSRLQDHTPYSQIKRHRPAMQVVVVHACSMHVSILLAFTLHL